MFPDKKQAIQNINKLLLTNGDCFLYIIADFTGFDIYKKAYSKWSEYMVDIDKFVSQYYHRIDPVSMLRNHLKNAGFKECNVSERWKTVAYHEFKSF